MAAGKLLGQGTGSMWHWGLQESLDPPGLNLPQERTSADSKGGNQQKHSRDECYFKDLISPPLSELCVCCCVECCLLILSVLPLE